jgi:hypothetical protein
VAGQDDAEADGSGAGPASASASASVDDTANATVLRLCNSA